MRQPPRTQLLMLDVSNCVDFETAKKNLEALGMRVTEQAGPRVYRRGCASGQVYDQVPPKDQRIKQGQPAVLKVSDGLRMKSFVGEHYEVARRWFADYKPLPAEPPEEHSWTIEAGRVSAQIPMPGVDLLSFGGPIIVTVSSGPSPTPTPGPIDSPTPLTPTPVPPTPPIGRPVPMPDLRDENFNVASDRLRDLTSSEIVRVDIENANPAGSIVDQAPPAKTDLRTWKKEITLHVSRGPESDDAFDWRLLLIPGVLIPGGIAATKVVRRRMWDGRVEANVSEGRPSEVRMTALEPPEDLVKMGVRVVPGSVRFEGPIDITERGGEQ